MDLQESISHFNYIKKEAEEKKRAFHTVWNKWAQGLLNERGWDKNKNEYLKAASEDWNKKASLYFKANSFRSNNEIEKLETFLSPLSLVRVIDFSRCIFPGRIIFQAGETERNFNFTMAKFYNGCTFKYCTFQKFMFFRDIECFGEFIFNNSIFVKYAKFSRVKVYNGDVDFSACKFEKTAEFDQCNFKEQVDFSCSVFEDATNFDNTEFHSNANFTAIQSKRAFSMMDTIFEVTPDFTSFRFDHHPYINGLTVKEQTKLIEKVKKKKENYRDDLKEEIRKLQALKAIAIQAHDHENELKFFASEMQCKELELSTANEETTGSQLPAILASTLNLLPYQAYRYISNYGQSIVQPIKIWSGLFVITWSVYFLASIIYIKFACINLGKAAYLSFLHNLPLLGLWRTENHQNTVKSLFTNHLLAWDIAFIIQNIIAGLIVFFFFQAIRNRFKIK